MNQIETLAAKALIMQQVENPEPVNETILHCVHKIADNYCFDKYRTHIGITTIEIVLQSLATYRDIVNISRVGDKDGNKSSTGKVSRAKVIQRPKDAGKNS